MSRSTAEMLDIKKTPEIYPMTSIQETLQYFHDKLNHLNARAYEASAAIQKLGEQVQQLRTATYKTKASVEQAQETVLEMSAAPEAGVERSAEKPEEAPYLLAEMYRRFSEQALLQEPLWARLQAKFKPERGAEAESEPLQAVEVEQEDLDSPEDLSPGLYRRLIVEHTFEDELQAEAVQEVPPTPARSLHFRRFSEQELHARGLRRPSLKMMPPDEMQDILDMAVTAASLRLDATPVFVR